jgi:RNA polymerase sigma-54 factor
MAAPSKLRLQQKLQQKLSPQQIQLLKLVQLPLAALEERIQAELEENPALEEGIPEPGPEREDVSDRDAEAADQDNDPEQEAEDLSGESETEHDPNDAQYAGEWSDDQTEEYLDREPQAPEVDQRFGELKSGGTFYDDLLHQWNLAADSERTLRIGQHLIGNLDGDGYLRRPLVNLSDDLALQENLMVEHEELVAVLKKVQDLDPPGIGARNLGECLLLQLYRKDAARKEWLAVKSVQHFDSHSLTDAILLLEHYFEDYGNRQFDRLAARLGWTTERMRLARAEILQLNPKPGDAVAAPHEAPAALPDFYVVLRDGKPELHLAEDNHLGALRVSTYYREMLEDFETRTGSKEGRKSGAGPVRTGSKESAAKSTKGIDPARQEAVAFIRSKIDQAHWFIDALEQRRVTLFETMQAIVDLQFEFFLTGQRARLRPMILKDVADRINMDISTVSRVVNSKFVQTWFGHFALKSFFSEGIATRSGEEASSIEVREVLLSLIEQEDKGHPLDDEALMDALRERGFQVARRTVAKYREILGIPVARLRRTY